MIFSVSELHASLNNGFEAIGQVEVIGEVMELRVTGSQGVFLTLKDLQREAVVGLNNYGPRIVGWQSVAVGDRVVARGQMQVYAPQGRLSLRVEELRLQGEGARQLAFERLKRVFSKEGLLDDDRKLGPPKLFEKVALLTAFDSAAYGDFVAVLEGRALGMKIDFFPVVVQGEASRSSILITLQSLSGRQYDGVVVIRGGGGVEDLRVFDDEQVVRALADLKVYKVVGIGHERDVLLAELVADRRVPTPTAAAQFLVDHNRFFWEGLRQKIGAAGVKLVDMVHRNLNVSQKMSYELEHLVGSEMLRWQQKLESFRWGLGQVQEVVFKERKQLEEWRRFLESVSPEVVFERGFSLVRDLGGVVVRSSRGVSVGQRLRIEFGGGDFVEVEVVDK